MENELTKGIVVAAVSETLHVIRLQQYGCEHEHTFFVPYGILPRRCPRCDQRSENTILEGKLARFMSDIALAIATCERGNE